MDSVAEHIAEFFKVDLMIVQTIGMFGGDGDMVPWTREHVHRRLTEVKNQKDMDAAGKRRIEHAIDNLPSEEACHAIGWCNLTQFYTAKRTGLILGPIQDDEIYANVLASIDTDVLSERALALLAGDLELLGLDAPRKLQWAIDDLRDVPEEDEEDASDKG